MSKRSGTPLYELIMAGRDRAKPMPEEPAEDAPVEEPSSPPPPAASGDAGWAGGRVLRVPVGYVLLASAAVLVLLIGAYLTGWKRAKDATEADFDRYIGTGQTAEAGRAQDPLTAPTVLATPTETITPDPRRLASPADEPQPGPSEAAWGPIRSDPRVAGWYYFVLMETRLDGAERLARFCRERGLEAYVIGDHNGRSFRVITLPALPTKDPKDPEVRELTREIARVGRAWAEAHPGESNLQDAYPIP